MVTLSIYGGVKEDWFELLIFGVKLGMMHFTYIMILSDSYKLIAVLKCQSEFTFLYTEAVLFFSDHGTPRCEGVKYSAVILVLGLHTQTVVI